MPRRISHHILHHTPHRRPRVRPSPFIVAAGLIAAMSACGANDDLSKQLDTIGSWTATTQLAAAEHRSGALTGTFVSQLDDEAKQALTEARRALPPAEHGADDARRAAGALDSLDRAIHLLDAELRR